MAPTEAIDDSQSSGWGSTTGDDDGTPTNDFIPKFIVIDMDTNVDITQFAVDPSATCGDGGSASMAEFRIETSPDGTAWTTAAEGTFTGDDLGQLNEVTPTAGADGVRFVKLTMLSNQTPDFETNCPDGAFSGCAVHRPVGDRRVRRRVPVTSSVRRQAEGRRRTLNVPATSSNRSQKSA